VSDAIDAVAREFHETYERLAPAFGYQTRLASAVAWDEVPEDNKRLMRCVVAELIERDVISAHPGRVWKIIGYRPRHSSKADRRSDRRAL
jgi:hypothetical protein